MIDRNLFLAILSMDSYNRGVATDKKLGIKLTGSQIGNAQVIKITENVKTSFYAVAYDWNGITRT